MDEQRPDPVRFRTARRLLEGSARYAALFAKENTVWLQQGTWFGPLLEGLVEPFLRRLGEELLAVRPDPAAPWTRGGGVLRLSAARGEAGLARELEFLRALLRELAGADDDRGADEDETLDFLIAAVDVLHDGALDEQARLRGDPPRHGSPRYGGVVLQLFEDPALLRAARRIEAYALEPALR